MQITMPTIPKLTVSEEDAVLRWNEKEGGAENGGCMGRGRGREGGGAKTRCK